MDYARKFGRGRNGRNTWAQNEVQDRIPQEHLLVRAKSEQPAAEDRRLSNWKRWLNDRARVQRRLSEKLNRKPLDLALNSHERARIKTETRCLMESACRSEVASQDKQRGNPAFWRIAERIRKNGEEVNEDVSVTLDRAAKCLPPEVTRVALPEFIKREKMLVEECLDFEKIDVKSKWHCGEYLRQRRAELKREIDFLEPNPPRMEDLVVVGKNFDRNKPAAAFIRTPVITITPELTRKVYLSNPDERIALRIQNREFVLEKGQHFEKLSVEETQRLRAAKQDEDNKRYAYSTIESDRVYRIQPKKGKSITWDLNFVTCSEEMCERKLTLENRGVRIVNISWRDVTPSFLPIPTIPRIGSNFFFNKNCVQILPGQKLEMPIWFRSAQASIGTETWKILVEPKVYPGALKLRLWGVAHGEGLKTSEIDAREQIKESIRLRVRDTMVREIVEELLAEAMMEREVENDIPYEMFFLKTDIFHARNPSHSYRSPLVDELNDMYKEVHNDDTIWSLSLDELRSVLLAIEDPIDRRQRLLRFREICDQLLRPNSVYSRPHLPKEKLARWLLAGFFNCFEAESEFALTRCCLVTKPELSDAENEGHEEQSSEIVCSDEDLLLYGEIFHTRIKCLLDDTVGRICAAVDSHDYFNKDGI